MSRRRILAALTAAALTAGPAAVAVPDAVPDRLPIASEGVARGQLVRAPAPDRAPSPKVVDGEIDDWIGEPSRIGGTSRLDAGEHIYSDFLFDAWGADDGYDADRLATVDPLIQAEPRLHRVDALQQAAGDQFDAPRPLSALDHYGDVDQRAFADLTEVRWAVQGDAALLLVRVANLTDAEVGRLGVQVIVEGRGTTLLTAATAAVNPAGWTNALEAALPASLLDGAPRVSVVAGEVQADGSLVPGNAAYRDAEPVTIYSERLQALALHAGDLDAFGAAIDGAALARGASESVRPGPGYHERTFTSGANISREETEHGILQPYGLYVPTAYDPATANPLTFWLHYRGGKTHSGAAWTPRLITQLGEEVGNLVVTPRGRGTSTWYVSEAHQDFFEVFADVHSLLSVDASRRYLSGYSMGGYGTYLFGLLYPDLFAAGYSTSGAVTQGAWTGVGPDQVCPERPEFCFVEANEGDADAQLTFRALDNARHFPIAIHHGTNDELVPSPGIERVALRLTELGYRHDYLRFHGYEHFTQAVMDEWAEGAAYLQRFAAPANPRSVSYRVVPALVGAVNTVTAGGVTYDFAPDGAYWVDGIVVREGAASGLVDATSEALAEAATVTVPMVGAAAPLGHSTTFTRTGLLEVELPAGTALDPTIANGATLTLEGVAEVTLDGARMGLDPTAAIDLTVTSDGPAVIHLRFGDEVRDIAVTAGTAASHLG